MDNNGLRYDLDDDEDDAHPWTSHCSGMHAQPFSSNGKIVMQGLKPSKLGGSRVRGDFDHNQRFKNKYGFVQQCYETSFKS
jgi:hypothetical protein